MESKSLIADINNRMLDNCTRDEVRRFDILFTSCPGNPSVNAEFHIHTISF